MSTSSLWEVLRSARSSEWCMGRLLLTSEGKSSELLRLVSCQGHLVQALCFAWPGVPEAGLSHLFFYLINNTHCETAWSLTTYRLTLLP